MRRYPCENFELRRTASIDRRSTDAMGRASHARRGDESGRLTCLPRGPGETTSRSRCLSSGPPGFLAFAVARVLGLATGSGLLAFAAPGVAQTGVTRLSNARLAPDRIGTRFKVDDARAFTVGSHTHRYKLSSEDVGMQNSVGTPVCTVSIHSNSSSSRPGSTVLGMLTNHLTAYRKTDGFPGAVAR